MRQLIVLWFFSVSVVSANAEYWFDNFDRYKPGPISDQADWTGNFSSVVVVSSGAASDPNALSLPYAPSASTRTAIYDGLDVSCASKILRLSFRLYRDNTGQLVKISLRDGTTERLYISTDTSDGTITVSGTDTGVAYPTGHYMRLNLFYNGSNNKVALTLNGTRILEWQDIGLTAFSRIDNLRLLRVGAVSGTVLFDDMSVQTIPSAVQAWWRFEEGTLLDSYEETGCFNPTTYIYQSGGDWEPAPAALYTLFNGEDAVRNRHARISTSLSTIDQTRNIDLGTNWTLEWIASATPTTGICTFFEWTTFYPPESTSGAWIRAAYEKNTKRILLYLRDDSGTGDGEFKWFPDCVPNDGQWHHFAITKQGTSLQAYIDYRLVGTQTLHSDASGAYSFNSNCYAYIGQTCSNTWTTAYGVRMDEVRISDNVNLPDFLRIDHPRFTQMVVGPASTELTFFAPPWEQSAIHRGTNMISGPWTYSGSHWAPTNYLGETKTVTVTKPSSGRGFYKIH